MIHPTSLSVAIAVLETGSVSEAARRVHLSQPSVSYHLRKLEAMVGGDVFRRGASGMIPTPAGEVLVAGARRILEELQATRDEARRLASGGSRPVRLSSACFTNYHWLPGILDEIDDMVVELDVDPGRQPFERLDRGEIDVALTTTPPGGGLFRAEELFRDEIVTVLAPDHPLAGAPFLESEDFADQSIVVFDRSRSDLFVQVLAPADIRPLRVIDVPVTEALLEMVRGGRVISAMARWIVEPDLEAGSLVAVRIGREGIQRTWHAVFSTRRPVPESAQALVRSLAATRSP